MMSLRARLALLSTLVSGVVILGFGYFAWKITERSLRESMDLRLAVPIDRIVRDLHPNSDNERVRRYVEAAFREDMDAGKLLLWIRRDRLNEVFAKAPETNWLEQLDPKLLKPRPFAPPERRRPAAPENANDFLAALMDGEDGLGSGPEPFRRPPPRRGPKAGDGPPPRNAEEGDPGPPTDPAPRPGDPGFGPPLDDVQIGMPPPTGEPVPIDYATIQADGRSWRVGVTGERGFTVAMGQDLGEIESELHRIRRRFLIGLPICLLAIGGGGWLVAHRAMRPVRVITETAEKITATGLDERIPASTRISPELANLVDVLNRMMDRLEHSFRHAMRFSADVSHELKTPLAIMQGEIEAALRECEAGTREEQNLVTLGQETQRLKAITGSLMLLAQADAGSLAVRRRRFSLTGEMEALAEDAEILCAEAGLTLHLDLEGGLEADSDPVLFRQALQNLVSNAVKYNHAGGRVGIVLRRTEPEGHRAVVAVSNTGPGIPEDERDKIFGRFYRVDKARSRNIDGFGLGLNLAWEIIRVLGGNLRLAEANEQETRFEIEFPVEKTAHEGKGSE
ncbi:MAG: HAMP domain-containing protein [Akkermansiaceae bacterium]|nr:HAMP domain-containing protein [Akkermansiaceae bacterium]